MPNHELIYRGKEVIEKLGMFPIAICGLGAIGSNLAVTLARMGAQNLTLIDKDKVERDNVVTQAYSMEDVGSNKTDALYGILMREVGINNKLLAHYGELDKSRIDKFLRGTSLVLDCFDNSASRGLLKDYCDSKIIPCLHLGVNGEYGEIRWNESYLVPDSNAGEDICDYPLSRTLIQLVVAVAAEVIIRTLSSRGNKGSRENYSITLQDLKVHRDIF